METIFYTHCCVSRSNFYFIFFFLSFFFRPVEIYDCALLRVGGGSSGSRRRRRRQRQRGGFIFLSGAKIPESILACDFVDRDIDRSLGVLPGGGELKPVEFRRRRHAKNDLDSGWNTGRYFYAVIHEWKQSKNPIQMWLLKATSFLFIVTQNRTIHLSNKQKTITKIA